DRYRSARTSEVHIRSSKRRWIDRPVESDFDAVDRSHRRANRRAAVHVEAVGRQPGQRELYIRDGVVRVGHQQMMVWIKLSLEVVAAVGNAGDIDELAIEAGTVDIGPANRDALHHIAAGFVNATGGRVRKDRVGMRAARVGVGPAAEMIDVDQTETCFAAGGE